MPDPDSATDCSVEEIQAALARMTHRGYDAPPGDWIQNAQPLRRVDSEN